MEETNKYTTDNLAQLNDRAIKYIKQVVADYYKISPEVYESKSRKREEINAKHTAIYFCYKNLKITRKTLGKYFNVDHASVIHIAKKMKGLLDWDKVLMREYDDLQALIEFKGMANSKVIDLENEYYFINMDDIISAKIDKTKSILFTGMTTSEINQCLNILGIRVEIKNHKKTGMYIMEKLKTNNNNDDANSNNTNEPTGTNNN
jgi:hypothetical protein